MKEIIFIVKSYNNPNYKKNKYYVASTNKNLILEGKFERARDFLIKRKKNPKPSIEFINDVITQIKTYYFKGYTIHIYIDPNLSESMIKHIKYHLKDRFNPENNLFEIKNTGNIIFYLDNIPQILEI